MRGEALAERPQPDHVPQRPADATVPGRWVDAGDLRVGDVLLLRDGRQQPITALATRSTTEPVYNFCVQHLHSYAVGGLQVLVHNNSGNSPAAKGVPLTIKEPRILSNAGLSDAERAFVHKHFRIKRNAVRSAARRGELVWSPGTDDVRIASLQEAHRARVAERFKRMFGRELNMTALNADHPVDLLIGGGADQGLRMLNESVNKSFGAAFLQAGRKAKLQPNQHISDIIIEPRR